MKIAVLGYGKQGMAAVQYWADGNEITVCDQNTNIKVPKGIHTQLGQGYLRKLDRFNLIVRSPSVHPKDIVSANSERILRKVTTVTEEFFRVCPAQIIGVTGTKGKGTTSSLITTILKEAGKTVHLGGNIGIPPLDMLSKGIKKTDWVVLELANFQLIDLGISPQVAVCLMVVPEHLDWHSNMEEYIQAKQNLFRNQRPEDRTVFNRLSDYSSIISGVSPAIKISYEVPPVGQEPLDRNGAYVVGEEIFMDDEKVCNVSDVALLGRHNLQNVCAAIAATWDIIDNNPAFIQSAVQKFKGLAHHLELIRDHEGVKYYDDSFGTNPETAIVALEALPGNKIIILGGSDKKSDYTKLAKAVMANNVKAVIQIGEMGATITKALQTQGFSNIIAGGDSMESIVQTAYKTATSGDIVLLSPACASFDMFKNYVDRGEQFDSAVRSL